MSDAVSISRRLYEELKYWLQYSVDHQGTSATTKAEEFLRRLRESDTHPLLKG